MDLGESFGRWRSRAVFLKVRKLLNIICEDEVGSARGWLIPHASIVFHGLKEGALTTSVIVDASFKPNVSVSFEILEALGNSTILLWLVMDAVVDIWHGV